METILRYDVLKEMDSGKAFSMSWVTYDVTRGTGGELKSVTNWCKVKKELDTDIIPASERTTSSNPASTDEYRIRGIMVNIYNPNNYHQHLTKVHLPLVTIFNGKRVIN